MAAQPRFFLVRPARKQFSDGTSHIVPGPIVPLIAVDELPEWLDIVSVPRELTVEQTIGLGNLGTASRSDGGYAVKIIHQATPTRPRPATVEDADSPKENTTATAARAAPDPTSSVSAPNSPTPATSSGAIAHAADRLRVHWADTPDASPGIASSVHNPHRSQPQGQQQQYCRHWCHHGTCKWSLHCRYLHAMPTTPAGLAAVGLRGIPAWWVATAAGTGGHRAHSHSYNHRGGAAGGDGATSPRKGAGAGGVVFDPRDVRAGMLPPAPQSGPPPTSIPPTAPTLGVGGGSNPQSKRAMRAAQLRETVALLRELGLGVTVAGKTRRREREINPLDKGRGARGMDREGVLRGARVELAAAAAAAATNNTVAAGEAGQERGVEGKEGKGKGVEEGKKEESGKGGVGTVQKVGGEELGKLVDV
ncbi:hypothetical protein C8A05DRAFT_33247 [Staphylotrichum tortipilum]|uniref:C3H1-type domain-containing protein n=1 Tax=Staphylotrichum tortipilum TaxID=2831512 RepID=A0AAN6MN77_9PEZI|nr:hypothetical protein C8A05DRAFT_33247 [Staphylotrichum longicolle]